MVEMSFNRIWGVPKPRPVWKRAWVYLLVMIVMPVLAAVAMSFPIMGAVKSVITATTGVTDYTKFCYGASGNVLFFGENWPKNMDECLNEEVQQPYVRINHSFG